MKLFLQRSKVEVPKDFKNPQQASYELDKHYSGWWRWLSEGGSKPIYYVDRDGRYSVIKADGHSQWKRNLWGGKEVGAHGHRWFGPRELPFKKSKEEKKEGEEAMNRYLKEIKRLQKEELKQLSEFLNKYDDEQWCEIIDVIWNCTQFKKDLIENQSGPINKELKLSLEELTGLSKHDKIDGAWDDLKTVIAKAIYIKKIDNYRTWISNYGVDWYREYYKDEGDKNKVNPVRLIADVWGNSDEIGFDCSKKETELKEWKSYFDECNQEAGLESGKKVKVVRVLKPTAWRSDNGGGYFVPYKKRGTSWRDNEKLRSDLESKYSRNIYYTGKLGELVVETCDHKKISMLFLVSADSPESTFCRTILEKFFGDVVKDKRYCLYEMPEPEGFLRKVIKNSH